MKPRHAYLLVSLFLLVELISSVYVFNFTTRDRKPVLTYGLDEKISSYAISDTGKYLAIGGEEGSLHYFSVGKGEPEWVYRGESRVLSVHLSTDGKHIVVLDENSTISYIRGLTGGEVFPKWTCTLEEGSIAGVYASGGLPVEVRVLTKQGGRMSLLSNRDGLVWEYDTGASSVEAVFSYDGRRIVAAGSDGVVYMFDASDPKPLWNVSTGLMGTTLTLSQNLQVVVGGKSQDGGGAIYAISREGVGIWEWRSEYPVRTVSTAHDGSKALSFLENGDAYVLEHVGGGVQDKIVALPDDVESIWSPPFGSYVLASTVEGTMYFFYTPRSAPLWKYHAGDGPSEGAVTTLGEKVFIVMEFNVALVSNTFQTGFIPGSRGLWGAVFFTGLFGAIGMGYFIVGRPDWLGYYKRRYKLILLGFLPGALLGFYLEGSLGATMVGGVGCAIGVLYGRRSEDLHSLVMGFFASMIVSLVAGYLTGLLIWFSGYEANIVTLTMVNASRGGSLGVITGILGVSLGLVSSRIASSEKKLVL